MKKVLLIVLILALVGAGAYWWMTRTPGTTDTASQPQTPAATPEPERTAQTPKPSLGHPLPGESVQKEQSFLEADYGFSLVLPVGWKVVHWTEPEPPQQGKRRPPYKIRLEHTPTGSLLDFACYPYTEKSRYAVEEIFISKMQPPVPGIEADIQMDEVVKEGEMRIRRAEMETRDSAGTVGLMRSYYYLTDDKLYTFSLMAPAQTFSEQAAAFTRILDDIRILG
jgi:hypothetical protein